MECPTIADFKDFVKELATRYGRYEFVNPFYSKRKKPQAYKSVYLKISNRYNLFYIYEDTQIEALKELVQFLEDYGDGLYPDIKAPFDLVPSPRGKMLQPQSLKRILGLYIIWVGKAVDPDKGIF